MNSLSWANLSVGGLKLIDISRVSSRTLEDLQAYDFHDVDVPSTIDAAMIDQSRRGDYPDVLGQNIQRYRAAQESSGVE